LSELQEIALYLLYLLKSNNFTLIASLFMVLISCVKNCPRDLLLI